MPHYRITLGCCQRVIRVQLPANVVLTDGRIFCEKCGADEIFLDPPEWQNISRLYTTEERHLDRRLDCLTGRRNAA